MKQTNPIHRTEGASWGSRRRGYRARPLEWLVEKFIFLVALQALLVIGLIFVFVLREALPVFLGRMDSSAIHPTLAPEDLDRLPSDQVRRFLGLSADQYRAMDRDTLRLLLEVEQEAVNEMEAKVGSDPDARLNTTRWRYLLFPHQWSGYDRPAYIWQPIGSIHKYNIVPLLIGSLKTTLVGLLFAVPLSVAAALFVSQLAGPRLREIVKPSIELLAGIPSVVIGFFALLVMATFLQTLFGYATRLNAFVAGIALGFSVIPIVFSIAEDALTSVPRSYTQGALALGASPWQAAWQIVLPAALPGIFAAVVLGFGRAIGETMIVLMVCSASVVSWDIFDSARSITTTIAAEMAEAVSGSHHYRILFMLGSILFAVSFASNLVADLVIHRLKGRLEGSR